MEGEWEGEGEEGEMYKKKEGKHWKREINKRKKGKNGTELWK